MKKFIVKHLKIFNAYKVNEIKHKIKMDDNSSPYNLNKTLIKKVLKRLEKIEFNRYPDSIHHNLLEKIIKLNNIKSINNISLGNGSDEIIQLLINMFVEKNEKILILSPSFAMFKIIPMTMGIDVIEIPLIETNNDWKMDMPQILKNLDKVKMIFIATPNNPTGSYFNIENIKKIIRLNKCIVVVDEAYYDYESYTFAPLIDKHKNLIIMRTFSKTLGLAGCRIGYLLSNKKIIELYNKIRLPYNINTLSAVTADTVLNNFNLIKINFKKLFSERKRIENKIDELLGKKIKIYKSNSNFIFIKTKLAKKIYDAALDKEKILLKYFNSGILKNCLRITVGTKSENNKLLKTIKKLVK